MCSSAWNRNAAIKMKKAMAAWQQYSRRNLVMPIFVFFRENVVVIVISELRPGSNERYENSTFYGPFRFLILILVFNK